MESTFFSLLHEDNQAIPENDVAELRMPVGASHLGRQRQPSVTQRLLRRKQVSLDMFGPRDFFEVPEEEEEELEEEKEEIMKRPTKKLFYPLRFSPRIISKASKRKEGETEIAGGGLEAVAPEEGDKKEATEISYRVPPDDYIVRATRTDFIKTGILFCIMIAFVGVCVGWKTHEDESHSLFGPVGLACVTPCSGDVDYRNFFTAHHDKFDDGDVSHPCLFYSFSNVFK